MAAVSFLPIVQRELRVVCRRRGTYWIRCCAALLALIVVNLGLDLTVINRGQQIGQMMFAGLSYYAFGISMLAGAFLAADCIAQERREGTLGFLFLTDLKGYDVVLGKFCGVSLNAFYGLLAIFPALGLCLLAGGVTGGEFWRRSLTLLNTLFYAVAFSILVSARSQKQNSPSMLALGLLAVIGFGGAMAVKLSAGVASPGLAQGLRLAGMASPGDAFARAAAANYAHSRAAFWCSLVVSNGLGWIFLGLAAWRLDFRLETREQTGARRFGQKQRIPALLTVNPILWLLDDSRWRRQAIWTLGICGAGVTLFSLEENAFVVASFYWVWPFYALLKILFAIQACRFFEESRRNGALELLGTTPLAGAEIIAGQWAALRRMFLFPVCLVLGANVLTLGSTIAISPLGNGWLGIMMSYRVLTQALDFLAIGWFGIWMGLRLGQPSKAVWITILSTMAAPLLLVCVPNIVIDLILLAIAQNKVSEWTNPRLRDWRHETRDQRTMVGGQAPIRQV